MLPNFTRLLHKKMFTYVVFVSNAYYHYNTAYISTEMYIA